MTSPERRIEWAVRIAPRSDRGRYEPEWRSDLAAAETHGLSPRDVGRGATRLAVRLRTRQVERVFLGLHGSVPALSAWLGLVALCVAAFLFGNAILLLAFLALLGLVVVFSRAGTPSHWSHWLMVLSIVTGAISAGFVWWVAGVKISVADSMTPEPAAAAWGGTALILFVLSGCALVVSALVAATRERRIRR